MENISLKVFLAMLVSCMQLCNTCSKVHRAGELSSSCFGSITLYDADSKPSNFPSSMDSIDEGLSGSMAKLEGCGCYRLYEGSCRRGRSVFVTKRGSQKIGLEVVRSLFKEDCSEIEINS